MSEDEYTPLIDREREPSSRVHEELTPIARERIAVILSDYSRGSQADALRFLMKKVGRTPILEKIYSKDGDKDLDIGQIETNLIENGETVHVLTYIEDIVKRGHLSELRSKNDPLSMNDNNLDISTETQPKEDTAELIDDLREVLITEGILWDIEMAGKGGVIEFVPLESESLEDIDAKVQALAESEPWDDALEGYNAAFERYLNGDFDDTLVTKLYNSIEEVLQTICVELEGWTDDRDRSHGDYLDILNEKGVYNANGITAPELNELLGALEKMVSKVGNDRKQRHAYHDRAYCTLLIHQVGAYLYFLISRYEDFKSK